MNPAPPPARLAPATSSFLDLLRIGAAFIVFLNHDVQFWHRGIWRVTNSLAHSAVVIFFVLSGYVIAYSTFSRHQTLRSYAVARLSRLYSVAIPALLLTVFCFAVGQHLNPAGYAEHTRGTEWPRYALTLVFLQSVLTLSASPPSNLPFWSLSYEFWYYALLGIALFVRRKGLRFALLGLGLLLITPNILLLLPCWLLGVATWCWTDRLKISPRSARGAFALAAVASVLLIACLPAIPFPLGHRPFWFSALFVTDWITAAAVAALIASFHLARFAPPPAALSAAIRYGADHTFSLYLFHYPLLICANAVLPLGQDPLRQTLAAIGIMAIVLILSTVTEARRAVWRQWFDRAWDLAARSRRAAATGA